MGGCDFLLSMDDLGADWRRWIVMAKHYFSFPASDTFFISSCCFLDVSVVWPNGGIFFIDIPIEYGHTILWETSLCAISICGMANHGTYNYDRHLVAVSYGLVSLF
jgi:hypothetical protein